MAFQYYFILQDLLGLLIAFLYSRLLILSIKLVFAKGFSVKIGRVITSQILFVLAGLILILNLWSMKTWLLFTMIILIALLVMPSRKER